VIRLNLVYVSNHSFRRRNEALSVVCKSCLKDTEMSAAAEVQSRHLEAGRGDDIPGQERAMAFPEAIATKEILRMLKGVALREKQKKT
jgi:hypothetical protein